MNTSQIETIEKTHWNSPTKRPILANSRSEKFNLSKYRSTGKRQRHSYHDETNNNNRENNINDNNNDTDRRRMSESAELSIATKEEENKEEDISLVPVTKDYGRITLDIPATEQIFDENGKEFTIYIIQIVNPDKEKEKERQWVKRYRYRELLLLHKHLMKSYPALLEKPFPSKTYTMKKSSSEVIDWRKFLLQKYLRHVINHETLCNDPKVKEYFDNDI